MLNVTLLVQLFNSLVILRYQAIYLLNMFSDIGYRSTSAGFVALALMSALMILLILTVFFLILLYKLKWLPHSMILKIKRALSANRSKELMELQGTYLDTTFAKNRIS